MNYFKTQWHIVYAVRDETSTIVYVGSSEKSITQLEINHRTFRQKRYKPTLFRNALECDGENWTFEVLHRDICTKGDIEKVEGQLIREHKPRYNKDYHPYETSVRMGRIIVRPPTREDKQKEQLKNLLSF